MYDSFITLNKCGSILQQGCHLTVFGKDFAAIQRREFNDKIDIYFLWIHRTDEIITCTNRPTGSEEVVVDQNNVIFIDGITVEFYLYCFSLYPLCKW